VIDAFSSFELALRTMAAVLFIASAVGKVVSLREFREIIGQYDLLPTLLLWPAAVLIPILETVIAVSLIAGVPIAAPAATTLLGIYGAAMAVNLLRGNSDINCGCSMSATSQQLSWTLVARNAVLAALLFLCDSSAPLFHYTSWGQAVVAGVILYLFYAALNVLWAITPFWVRKKAQETAGVA